MERRCVEDENITGYLKNHWTKHRLVCIHCDAFFTLIPNIDMIHTISEFYEIL